MTDQSLSGQFDVFSSFLQSDLLRSEIFAAKPAAGLAAALTTAPGQHHPSQSDSSLLCRPLATMHVPHTPAAVLRSTSTSTPACVVHACVAATLPRGSANSKPDLAMVATSGTAPPPPPSSSSSPPLDSDGRPLSLSTEPPIKISLSGLVLVPAAAAVVCLGFCAGGVGVWQLCSGKMLFLGQLPLELF